MESYITKKKHIWDLKISGVVLWRGEAVKGGAVFGGGGAVYKYNSYPLCSIAETDFKL